MSRIAKEKIYEASVRKQQALIDNFESRVREMKEDVYSQQQSASQSENRQTGKLELLSTLETELNFTRAEMSFLKTLDPKTDHENIEPGAVVVTNLRTFFIAVSSEAMEVDGQPVFGISTRAPLYQRMAGLSKGGKFEFNGTAYEIKDVY